MDSAEPSNENPDEPQESEQEESLLERSVRLEAEAARLAGGDLAGGDDIDPLAPQPLGGNPDDEMDAPPAGNAQSAALQEQLNQAKDQMMRAIAEAENTRKRAQKDREEASKFAISGFARDLLDVADNLRRALSAVPDDLLETEPRLKNLVDGIEATERELLRSLEKNGVEKLEPTDEPFDPNFHEVMFEMPDSGKPAGTITQVIEIGYILHDRLLRPARVAIAKDDGSADGGGPPPPTHPGGQIDTEV